MSSAAPSTSGSLAMDGKSDKTDTTEMENLTANRTRSREDTISPLSPTRSATSGRRRSTAFSPRRSSTQGGDRSVPMGPPRSSIQIPRGAEHPSAGAGPPSLEYTLKTRKTAIIIFWSFVVIDSVFMPIALYFGLWYGTNLSPNTVFSIVTAAIGGISIFEYFVRFWRLFKKGSTCRVIGGRRAYLDWFHWCYTGMWLIVMVELIIGSTPTNPPIRLLAMPLSTLLWTFGSEMLVVDLMRIFAVPCPFRMSSIPKGSILRPAIYTFIEDVVAVDGSGGTAFRERLNARFEASHVFRQMLHRLTLFWGVGAEGMALLTTILIFTLEGDYAYAVGWSAPFVWAGLWALGTWWYVERNLKIEKERWGENEEGEKV